MMRCMQRYRRTENCQYRAGLLSHGVSSALRPTETYAISLPGVSEGCLIWEAMEAAASHLRWEHKRSQERGRHCALRRRGWCGLCELPLGEKQLPVF